MRSAVTPTSSSAQPVTAIAPLRPVAPSAGVSNVPKGGVAEKLACVTVTS